VIMTPEANLRFIPGLDLFALKWENSDGIPEEEPVSGVYDSSSDVWGSRTKLGRAMPASPMATTRSTTPQAASSGKLRAVQEVPDSKRCLEFGGSSSRTPASPPSESKQLLGSASAVAREFRKSARAAREAESKSRWALATNRDGRPPAREKRPAAAGKLARENRFGSPGQSPRQDRSASPGSRLAEHHTATSRQRLQENLRQASAAKKLLGQGRTKQPLFSDRSAHLLQTSLSKGDELSQSRPLFEPKSARRAETGTTRPVQRAASPPTGIVHVPLGPPRQSIIRQSSGISLSNSVNLRTFTTTTTQVLTVAEMRPPVVMTQVMSPRSVPAPTMRRSSFHSFC